MNFYSISNLDIKIIYIENENNDSSDWRECLFKRLMFFARSRARKYNNFSKKDDILQESYLGLWRSIQTFDHYKNFDFYRWAHWNISSKIKNFLSSESMNYNVIVEKANYKNDCDFYENNVEHALQIKNIFEGNYILTKREKIVLSDLIMRGKTLREVGGEIGLSEERVRQIKEESLFKIRRVLNNVI
jgi:RNA polymerase sigma factor (sigma-70 family)